MPAARLGDVLLLWFASYELGCRQRVCLRQQWGEGLPDDPDRSLHAELCLFASVLGAQDAGEDVDTWPLVDQLLLDAAW